MHTLRHCALAAAGLLLAACAGPPAQAPSNQEARPMFSPPAVTVHRELKFARAWLQQQMAGDA